jgi:WD40 repeat protein
MPEPSPSRPLTDRNLLFGILALQMDFISRDSLIAAMGAWVLDKDKALGQILVDQAKMSPEHLALLEPLVQAHVKAHGDDPHKSLASLSSLGSAREELRQIVDPDVQASLAKVSAERPTAGIDPVDPRTPTMGAPTSTGLRFRILRPYVGIATAAAVLAVATVSLAAIALLLLVREKDATKHRQVAEKQLDEARLNEYALGLNLAQRALEESNIGQARALLDAAGKQTSGGTVRGFEWYYLSRRCHQLLLTCKHQSGPVNAVVAAPDGRRLASAGTDQMVRVWETASGKELLTLKGHTGEVYSVAVSPDGTRIASASADKSVKVWDAERGIELFTLQGHPEAVYCVAFSPDGKRIASAGQDKTVRVWNAATAKEILTLSGHADWVRWVAFSPDGNLLASAGGDNTLRIWDSATGREICVLTHSSPVYSAAFSPDGRDICAGCADATLIVWQLTPPAKLITLNGHMGRVTGLAYSSDGLRISSACEDKSAAVWDAKTGKQLFTLAGHTNYVFGTTFTPDGQRLATASSDGTVKIWDVDPDPRFFSIQAEKRQPVMNLAFTADGQWLACQRMTTGVELRHAETGEMKVCHPVSGSRAFRHNMHTGIREAPVTFTPDGTRYAYWNSDEKWRVCDTATGKELFAQKDSTPAMDPYGKHLALSPDGRSLVTFSDGNLRNCDVATDADVFKMNSLESYVTGMAFSPDGQRLAIAHSSILILDATTGKQICVARIDQNPTTAEMSFNKRSCFPLRPSPRPGRRRPFKPSRDRTLGPSGEWGCRHLPHL